MDIKDALKSGDKDLYQPNINEMWEGLQVKRNRSKRLKIQWLKGLAAVLVLGLFLGVLVRQELIIQQQVTTLSQINESLKEKETDYVLQVSNKWESYVNMQGTGSSTTPMLMDELKNLDTLYQNGMNNLLEYGYNERLVINLMNTYEKRLRIIEYLILEKQKQRNYERKVQQVDI